MGKKYIQCVFFSDFFTFMKKKTPKTHHDVTDWAEMGFALLSVVTAILFVSMLFLSQI